MRYTLLVDMQGQGEVPPAKYKYLDVLTKEEAAGLLRIFSEIDAGKYDLAEVHTVHPRSLRHPVSLRAIRADMQSFVNTFIDPYLEKKPYFGDVKYVIDAGGNIGYTAVLFANWWPQARIISIEADRANYELAVKNTAVYPNITVLHGGLWNKHTMLTIEAGQEDGFVVREIKNTTGVNEKNLTQGFSVDQLMEKYSMPRVDFLKMNIEGSEKEVFSVNFEKWLPATTSMLIELHDGKNKGCSKTVFSTINQYDLAVCETAPYGVLFAKESVYRQWYAKWYREEIYQPNISKERFPEFYLDKE